MLRSDPGSDIAWLYYMAIVFLADTSQMSPSKLCIYHEKYNRQDQRIQKKLLLFGKQIHWLHSSDVCEVFECVDNCNSVQQ